LPIGFVLLYSTLLESLLLTLYLLPSLGLPPSVKMELEPLEFSLKKSREFAQSIERYVLSRWNKNTPPTSEAVVELFTDLLACVISRHKVSVAFLKALPTGFVLLCCILLESLPLTSYPSL
jgi:hypothetical protein